MRSLLGILADQNEDTEEGTSFLLWDIVTFMQYYNWVMRGATWSKQANRPRDGNGDKEKKLYP